MEDGATGGDFGSLMLCALDTSDDLPFTPNRFVGGGGEGFTLGGLGAMFGLPCPTPVEVPPRFNPFAILRTSSLFKLDVESVLAC